jgi:hypothetical protein
MNNQDGLMKRIVASDLTPGTVLRMLHSLNEDGTWDMNRAVPFSDCVVLKVESNSHWMVVKLARPYCYVSGASTGCPSILQGYEMFEVSLADMLDAETNFRTVVQPSKEGLVPYNYTT